MFLCQIHFIRLVMFQKLLSTLTICFLLTSVFAQKGKRAPAPDVIIPVVFHVIHGGGIENITDDQMIECLVQMNEDYNAENEGFKDVVSEFADIKADIGFKFALARKDPQGNSTSGIVRHYDPIFTWMGNECELELKKKYAWPRNMYMNVYVIRSAGGEAGSAWADYPKIRADMDGVVSSYWAVGRTRVATPTHVKIMTHEVGHWLWLPHTFSGGCDSEKGDGIDDTPPTNGAYNSSAGRCDLKYSPCGEVTNVQNFMDYSSCTVMFTEGQKKVMWNSMTGDIGDRNNLWTRGNLTATGVIGEAVSAQFYGHQIMTVPGNGITYHDFSVTENKKIEKWEWEFPGGIPAKFTGKTPPKVIYHKVGKYDVKLSVTDKKGNTDFELKKEYISVQTDVYMQTADFSVSNVDFYDHGYKGRYGVRTDATLTLRPNSKGKTLVADFESFRMEEGDSTDYLLIYDGPSTKDRLIGEYMGYKSPRKIRSTHVSGALTFVMHTNVSGRYDGWKANVYEVSKSAKKPVAKFRANSTNICAYEQVQFSDVSDYGVTSRKWMFEGGIPESSTEKNPTVVFPTGFHDVTLTVTNEIGSDTKTEKQFINSGVGAVLPYSQSFEEKEAINKWKIFNSDALLSWEVDYIVGNNSTSSLAIRPLTDDYNGELDEITMESINTSEHMSVEMTFDLAWHNFEKAARGVFKVYVSDDCGTTWREVYNLKDMEQSELDYFERRSWIPTKAEDWEKITINLDDFAAESNVLIKFSNIATEGTRIWIDNISVIGN